MNRLLLIKTQVSLPLPHRVQLMLLKQQEDVAKVAAVVEEEESDLVHAPKRTKKQLPLQVVTANQLVPSFVPSAQTSIVNEIVHW